MTKFQPSTHSSKLELIGSKSKLLAEKKVLFGLTGSVAVLEIVRTARLLMRHGAEVYAAMSSAAIDLIHPNLVEWAIGNPVITELTGQIEHVHLCGEHPAKVDLVLVAPSTANTIGKIASGIDDTPVTTMVTTALGTGIPIAIVPAMHATMYENPIVQKNIDYLSQIGIHFIGPRKEEGKAKIATSEEILENVIQILTPNDYHGKKVVVTAGPTRIWIDEIRFISNPSSGKMGLALALEAASRGADVTLIIGPTTLTIPNIEGIETIEIETPQEIIQSIDKIKTLDIFISAAAISDYEPKESLQGKIPSKKASLTIELKPAPKVIAHARDKFPQGLIIGFKAETNISKEELIKRAIQRLEETQLDMMVANFVNKPATGFNAETNEVYIIKKSHKEIHLPLSSKRMIAKKILDEIKELF
ncbi:MAG: bifunctional phosphopantothenoylcysteine decarboxylase/phosphopantothenate--cysteine ligase CoaBC [Candidatus Heimdallarchaeota archaeon]|nr:bifunctional phosphopantothenoylcysteine decarboxylase/phosphopantothenate--cysteine ligase CoaBC [Candidatus Heimdallarchaeota archaeon]